MRTLILGGTNFIGPRVVHHLVEAGHDVTVFHRGQKEPELPPSVRHIHGDRANLTDFRDEFKECNPEILIDMRCLTQADAEGVRDVFTGIARRAILIGSMDVYRAFDVVHSKDDVLQTVPFDEDSDLRKIMYPYRADPLRAADDPQKHLDDYDKILCERVYLANTEMPGTALRLPAVYGPGDYQHRFQHVAKRMNDGRRVIVVEEQLARWRFVHGYVEDVAAAIVLAATDDRAAGRTYNIGEKETPKWQERTERIAEACGIDLKVYPVTSDSLPETMRVTGIKFEQDLSANTDRIRNELGFAETVPEAEGLRITLDWEREHLPETMDLSKYDYEAEDGILAARL